MHTYINALIILHLHINGTAVSCGDCIYKFLFFQLVFNYLQFIHLIIHYLVLKIDQGMHSKNF